MTSTKKKKKLIRRCEIKCSALQCILHFSHQPLTLILVFVYGFVRVRERVCARAWISIHINVSRIFPFHWHPTIVVSERKKSETKRFHLEFFAERIFRKAILNGRMLRPIDDAHSLAYFEYFFFFDHRSAATAIRFVRFSFHFVKSFLFCNSFFFSRSKCGSDTTHPFSPFRLFFLFNARRRRRENK